MEKQAIEPLSDKRKLYEMSESELDDLLYDFAVTKHGHCSVKSFCNDLGLWGQDLDHALTVYGNQLNSR